METQKLTYSIAEVCAACGLGRTTIYLAIKRGELKFCKIKRRTLIRRADLEAWLLDNVVGGAQ
jgi:excisionase family DNA binding protein